jgi:hypothetical protein
MKTYSEKQGEKPFDWFEFLTRENLNDGDWLYAKDKAISWVTCACGNQCAIIPRKTAEGNINGEPLDKVLKLLGGDEGFFYAIQEKDAKLAIEFLLAIENRSQYLIKKEIENIPKKIEELKKSKEDFIMDVDSQIAELNALLTEYS